jgi:competence protein ComEC
MFKKYYKLVIIFFVLVIIFSLLYLFLNQKKENNLEVIFLDVGQGDAILIKTPVGQNILIDGGEDKKIIKRLSEELSWWDRKIDLMILTHPHSDHVGGLVDVLQRYEVLKILYTGARHNSPDYLTWLKLIREKEVNLNIINHQQKILLADALVLDIIYPGSQDLIDNQKNLNNTSIVARLSYGKTSFLFMGDAEIETEEILLEEQKELKADVLKIGHHGSDTSSTDNFLRMVDPDYAVIEVGEDNHFNHPSPRIIRRLERLDIKIFRTDINGSIKFISDGIDLEIDK